MNAQQALHELEDAKAALKTAKDAYKDAAVNNSTLSDLAEAKKQANADYRAEKEQFDGTHAALVEKISELTQAKKEAQLLFDETVEVAIRNGEQLELFSKDGREVSVHLSTRITVQKDVKKTEAEPDDEAE